MTIQEIKTELKIRGWTQAQLAEKLKMNKNALNGILCGARPLTETLSAHIDLLLGKSKEQVIMYKVTLPDEVVERWVPGWDNLTEDERQAAVKAVLMDAVAQLQAMGESRLSPDERAQLQTFCGAATAPRLTPSAVIPAPPSYGDTLEPFA